MAALMLSGSPGAISRALSPSVTISGTPPTAVATTGTLVAIASSKALGEPSLSEDKTATSAMPYQGSAEFCWRR